MWDIGAGDRMAEQAASQTRATAGKRSGRHRENQLTAISARKKGPGRHSDGKGLYLVVDPSGTRRWVLRVMVQGRRQDIGLGGASVVSLAEARESAQELLKVARAGGDPRAVLDREKRASLTLSQAAREVHAQQVLPTSRNAKAGAQWISSLEASVFPSIGDKPVHAVDQADVLRVLSPIWLSTPETARRVRQRLRTVLDWATTAGLREGVNPVEGIEKGLPKHRGEAKHFAALPWAELPNLWSRLVGVAGMGALALRFCILTAARSGEVRRMEWRDVDLETKVWTVPAAKMKARREHRVPLSDSAIEVLRAARPLRAKDEALVFPSPKSGKALSDMTLSAVLKRLGLAVTVHGFRSTFRDWAEEEGAWPHEVKEAALAHIVRSKTERAYRRTDLFEKRRAMMADWATFATGFDGTGARR